ncbi:MAG: HEAT repeat domain-containing protein [Vicinamibacteria bacterium]
MSNDKLSGTGVPRSPDEKPLPPERKPDDRKVAGARELLRLLVKTQKAHRLYEAKNAVSERLEQELFERLTAFVSEEGEIQLTIQEAQIRCDEVVVLESADRNDSLAFLLYRDGIRRLSFGSGLEVEELRTFLRCLNRVAVLTNDQDDLVTLLWEQDFHSIRYFAIEELARHDSYPGFPDQLATAGGTGEGGGAPAQAVTLDLRQPVSTVPVEACRLESSEIEILQKELWVEERAPFRQLVSELALELVLLEEGAEERDELRENLLAIADRLVADGELAEVVGLHEHVDGLATMAFPTETSLSKLAAELTSALAEPQKLETFLEKVETVHAPKPEALTVFLARLGAAARGSLFPWMARFSSPAYRRAVTGALLFLEDGGLSVLRESLPSGAAPADPLERLRHRQLVREVIHALSRHPAESAIPLLEQLQGAADPDTRRESFVALSRYPEERVLSLCLERLTDRDPEVRATALDTIVRKGASHLGLQILERSLGNLHFDGFALIEKRRIFAAVAKLAGESALESFQKLLMRREEHWFASQKDRHFAEAVAHGIRMVGTPRARTILVDCSESAPRFARPACLKELEAPRS